MNNIATKGFAPGKQRIALKGYGPVDFLRKALEIIKVSAVELCSWSARAFDRCLGR